MFGGGKRKPPVESWEFDLEKDLKKPNELRAIKEKINSKVQNLKTIMRKGEDKNAFDQTQVLLHGYLAMQKVIQRAGRR